jgi:dTDP-glucose 4,6-dehydratase
MRLHDGRVVPNFIYQALTGKPLTVFGDGMRTRSFQYYTDLVEGIYRLLNSDENLPVNIGNPSEITILEFAEAVLELTGSKSEIHFIEPTDDRITDDPMVRRPDNTRAHEILGWQPQVNLAEGLQKTIEYFAPRIDK